MRTIHNRNDVHLIQMSFSCSGGGVHFINKLTTNSFRCISTSNKWRISYIRYIYTSTSTYTKLDLLHYNFYNNYNEIMHKHELIFGQQSITISTAEILMKISFGSFLKLHRKTICSQLHLLTHQPLAHPFPFFLSF